MKENNTFKTLDFATLFEVHPNSFSPTCRALMNRYDFSYRRPTSEERVKIVSEVQQKNDSLTITHSTDAGKTKWETGWRENLQEFISSGFNLNTLLPKFVKPSAVVRLFEDYAIPHDPHFELYFREVLRYWLAEMFLNYANPIYEFGCGTASNLIALAQQYPEKRLYGLDWVTPPIEIMRLLNIHHGFQIEGQIFNMLTPDEKIRVESGGGIFMMGAMEQLGEHFQSFLLYLLEQRSIVVQIDPFIELYDEKNTFDHPAIQFEQKRKYLSGYLSHLKYLSRCGTIEILSTKRVRFGSMFHDGYSFVVWRPRVT